MKQKKQSKEQARAVEARRLKWIGGISAAVILLVIIAAVVFNAGHGSEKDTLERYYAAMYEADGSLEDAVACIIPSRQQETYNQLTSGGTNFRVLAQWRADAMTLVGDNVKVRVDILDRSRPDSGNLNTIRQTYPDAEEYRAVSFRLTLTGEDGTRTLVGIASMLRVKGSWYLSGDGVQAQLEAEPAVTE